MSIRENNKPIELFREIGNDHVSSIYTFAKSDIYLGTEGSGLYHLILLLEMPDLFLSQQTG